MNGHGNAIEALKEVIQADLKTQTFIAPDYSATSVSVAYAVESSFDIHPRGTDWRVLGGVIPGPIPAEWARVGDTIRDNGVTGTITRIVNTGRMVHLYIDSGHVCFAKVTRQDWVHVTSAGNDTVHADGSRS